MNRSSFFILYDIINMTQRDDDLYSVRIASPKDIRLDRMHDYAWEYRRGLMHEFYWRVMCFLDKHEPDTLMREDFRANCERIYEEIPDLKIYYTYNDLYNSHELQEILEAWNDLYLNDLDEYGQA